jgi:Xaa-Pro aminopeptidase
MLTAEGCSARRERLWASSPSPCDLIVIGDPQHLIYFANYSASPFVFRSADAGAVLILQPDRSVLVADNLVQPFLDEAHVDEVAGPVWYNGQGSAPHRQALLVRSTLDALAKVPGRRVGFESGTAPAGVIEGLRSARPGLDLVDLSDTIRRLKRSKDSDELVALRKAIQAAEAGQAAALAKIVPGMTEFEAYLVIQQASLEAAADQAIVYGDFVSGPRCEEGGGPPSQRKIAKGDLFLADFSVVIRGYRGDFANTLSVGAPPTPQQQDLFGHCLAALEAGEKALKPGASASEVFNAVRHSFAGKQLDQYFTSHAGHGIGLGHPEPPYLVPDSTDTIFEGDVVAIEPGLYISGVAGMRYEHNYRVTSTGFETLSKHRLTISA